MEWTTKQVNPNVKNGLWLLYQFWLIYYNKCIMLHIIKISKKEEGGD